MITDIWSLCRFLSIDCLVYALYDWNILGQVFGFRLSEWAQNKEDKGSYPKKAINRTPLTFTICDFVFYSPNKTILNQGLNTILAESDIESIEICWCFQKNSDNSQKISVTRNLNDLVSALYLLHFASIVILNI